jgi:hypothetical protein
MSTNGDAGGLPRALPARRGEGKKRAFLQHLARTGSVVEAASAAGFSDSYAHRVRKRDTAFADAWDEAIRAYESRLVERGEREAARRGIEGWREPVYQNGKLVGHKRRFSDRLLLRTLEAHRPEKWGRKSTVNHTGIVGLVSPEIQARLADPGVLERACGEDAIWASQDLPRLPRPADDEVIDVEAELDPSGRVDVPQNTK